MKNRLARVAKWIGYPLFYLLCLALFGYLTFPFDALKGRIVAEFDRAQQKQLRRPGEQPMQLTIGELDSYWFSGVEVTGAKLVIPPEPKRPSYGKTMMGGAKDDKPAQPTIITIDRARARVRLWPLLVGDVMIDFRVETFGGVIEGSLPYGDSGDVDVELTGIQLHEIEPLAGMLQGMPLIGALSGTLKLAPKNGKFARADGEAKMTIDKVILGDGKSKLQGIALPAAQLGTVRIEASAKNGQLKLESLAAKGRDFELEGEGKVRLSESWQRAHADLYLKFKFTDAYRDKSDATRGLLGKPGDSHPAIEIDPTIRRSKTADGFYRFHIHGRLGRLDFSPAGVTAGVAGRATGRMKPRGLLGRPPPKARPADDKPTDDEAADEDKE